MRSLACILLTRTRKTGAPGPLASAQFLIRSAARLVPLALSLNPRKTGTPGPLASVKFLIRSAARLVPFALLAAAMCLAEDHPAKGIVLQTDISNRSLAVSCAAIPGYMDAMAMEFTVRDPKPLLNLKTGAQIGFTIVEHKGKLFAENIRELPLANFEAEPMQAAQLATLTRMIEPGAKELNVGDQVPDFALTDQTGKSIRLSQFQGKVVALTFGYSRCPNPTYCFRLSNNLAQMQQRAGRDLVLATVMIDPEHDQGENLSRYAAVFKADPHTWHFLTGPLPQIKQVAGMFGMDFWRVDGLLTHTLKTVIIDRHGRLAVNLDGNQFTPRQLNDLVKTVIAKPN